MVFLFSDIKHFRTKIDGCDLAGKGMKDDKEIFNYCKTEIRILVCVSGIVCVLLRNIG